MLSVQINIHVKSELLKMALVFSLGLLAWWPPALAPLRASAETAALLLERPASLLRVTGAGRRQFIHGLCTADVNAIGDGGVVDASVVDATGRTLSLLTLIDAPPVGGAAAELLAIGPADRGAALFGFFDRYAFPADCATPTDATGAYRCYEVVGPSAASALSEALADALGGAVQLPSRGQALRVAVGTADAVVANAGSLGFPEALSLLVPCTDESTALCAALRRAVAKVGGVDGTAAGDGVDSSEFDGPTAVCYRFAQ